MQGRIQDFHWGGGGVAKDYVRKPKVPYGQGPGLAYIKGEALGFLMLSCAIWALF